MASDLPSFPLYRSCRFFEPRTSLSSGYAQGGPDERNILIGRESRGAPIEQRGLASVGTAPGSALFLSPVPLDQATWLLYDNP